MRINRKSDRFIPRIVIIFAKRSDLDAPVDNVLIETNFTEVSTETNHLALS